MSDPQYKEFHIGDVLTITTGRLISQRGMDGVYDILNFLTGDDLFTHQLPRVSQECLPLLLEQFPQLADFNADGITKENWRMYLDSAVEKYGEMLNVKRIPGDAHERRDPVQELSEMIGKEKVVVVLK